MSRTPSSRLSKSPASACSAGSGPRPAFGPGSARPNPEPKRSVATAVAVIALPVPKARPPRHPATTRRPALPRGPQGGGPPNERARQRRVHPARRGPSLPPGEAGPAAPAAPAAPKAMPAHTATVAGDAPRDRPSRKGPTRGTQRTLAPPVEALLEPVPAGRPTMNTTTQAQAQEAGWTFHSTSRG